MPALLLRRLLLLLCLLLLCLLLRLLLRLLLCLLLLRLLLLEEQAQQEEPPHAPGCSGRRRGCWRRHRSWRSRRRTPGVPARFTHGRCFNTVTVPPGK